MFTKIKKIITKTLWQAARDVRVAGLLGFLVIVLLISWSGVKVIQSNYGLQKQISELRQENNVQQLANNNLQLQNDYLNSNQYLELSARQNLGLGAPGETELLVPDSVALKHVLNLPSSSSSVAAPPAMHQSTIQRNLSAWIDFYLHRPNPSD